MRFFNKKTVKEITVEGRRVIHRVALDVPLKPGPKGWEVVEDLRIRRVLPTLNYLLEKRCRVVMMSYLGRPEGVEEDKRLDPVAERLSLMVGQPVRKLSDCVGREVEAAVRAMRAGEIVMLENTRFHREEYEEDEEFSRRLAKLGEVFVQDAFAQCHRRHASVTGVARFLPAVAGLGLVEEIESLSRVREEFERPLVVVIGGGKVGDKARVIGEFLKKADWVLVGGAVANVFLQAKGVAVGRSKVGDELGGEGLVEEVKGFLESERLVLPVDLVATDNWQRIGDVEVIEIGKRKIPDEWMFVDIGPETAERFSRLIEKAKTVFWSGPMGVFEKGVFARGSWAVAEAMGRCQGFTVVSGGDTIEAVGEWGDLGVFSYVSAGGGASLKFLAGEELPGVAVLEEREE